MSRPLVHATPRTATAVRFPPETHDRLRRAALERGLSINHLVNAAVVELLDNLIPVDELRLTRRVTEGNGT